MYLLVAIDKFTKWIEAKPVTSQATEPVVKFIFGIVHHFVMTHSINTDNGMNFTAELFRDYCRKHRILLDYTSVAHLQSNGQVAQANGLIIDGIKPQLLTTLEKSARKWVDELPAILWSIRMMPNRSTGFTPFIMVYLAEVILPSDIKHDSPHVVKYAQADAEADRKLDIHYLEEIQELALACSAIYRWRLHPYHSRHFRGQEFNVGDLVLRLDQEMKVKHKLRPPWEGPFMIHHVLHDSAYRLPGIESDVVFPRSWNIVLLCHFYT